MGLEVGDEVVVHLVSPAAGDSLVEGPGAPSDACVDRASQRFAFDAEEDLEQLAAWAERRGTSVWVRLVKGAYWDYETILAEQNGWEPPVWQMRCRRTGISASGSGCRCWWWPAR